MKNRKSKILSFVLAVTLIASLFAGFTVNAATYSGKCGDNLTWSLNTSTGVLTISGTGKMTDYSSSSLSSVPWYGHCSSIKTVTIGSGVTSIGDYAFGFCEGLTSITIPSSVTSIGNYAFYYCDGLTSITIPSGVTSIGSGAFCYCRWLTSITIPSSVTSIGSGAFYGCEELKYNEYGNAYYLGNEGNPYHTLVKAKDKSITSCTINGNTRLISDEAFYQCSGLTSITIPSSVTSIGNCSGLESITVASGNSVYRSENNCIIEKATNTLICGCKNSVIPSSVTSIGDDAFYGCSGLTSISIPSGVTSIGDSAFGWCSGLTSVTIGSGVTSIGNYAFEDCYRLTSISIPSSVTSIGDQAFFRCSGLKTVYYGGTLEQKKSISIGSDNSYLTPAKWVFTQCNDGHHYDNACDTTCNVCGATRVTEHVYDNDFDTTCNVCGSERTVTDVSGTYGESCIFDYTDADKTLTLSGSAADALVGIDAPWKSIANKIAKVVVGKTVAHISGSVFEGLSPEAPIYVMGDPEIEDGALPKNYSIFGWSGTKLQNYCSANENAFTALEEFTALGYQVGAAKSNMFRVIAQMRYADYYEAAGFDITAVGSDGFGHDFNKTLTQNISKVYKSVSASSPSGVQYTAVTAEDGCYLSAFGMIGLPEMAAGAKIVFTVTPFVYNIFSGEKVSLDPVMLQYTADGISQYIEESSGLKTDEGTTEGGVINWNEI